MIILKILFMMMMAYSVKKNIANGPAAYSMLEPDTDSPSVRLKGVQLVSARVEIRRRQWHPTPVLLSGKSHGRRSLEGPWGRWGSDTTERLHFHSSLSCIGEGNGNPLQCSYLENPRESRAWWAAVCGVAQSRTWLKWLSSSSSPCNFLSLHNIVTWGCHFLMVGKGLSCAL